MARNWQQIKNDIIGRAHMVFAEVIRIRETMPAKKFANIAYSKQGDEDYTTTLCRYYMKEGFSPDVKKASQVIQVDGMCGGQKHSWFQIEPDEEAKAQKGLEELEPDYFYIVDVGAIEVLPPVLLVSPKAPMKYMYGKLEDIPCPPEDQS